MLSPIKLAQITIGIAMIGEAAAVENPYFVLVPLGIVMAMGFIAMVQGTVETARSGKPLGNFPFSW